MNAVDTIQSIQSLATSISTSTADASIQVPMTTEDVQSLFANVRYSADKIQVLARAFVE